jgi:acetyl esterase/lipase
MPIDPYLARKLPLLNGLTFAALGDPALLERFLSFYGDDFEWSVPDGVVIIDDVAGGTDGIAGAVPVRVYRPTVEPHSALLWFHGGGFQGGNLDMPEAHVVSAELAARASALVISVDYRLAVGGVHYPAPVDDGITAWRALLDLIPSTVPAAVGGASAGAAIAMSVALRAEREGLRGADALLLAYPFVHFPTPAVHPELEKEMGDLPGLVRFTAESIEGMVSGYVGRVSNVPLEAMPGAAALNGLPATTIVLSEYDDLRPSGELLASQLAESGVAFTSHLSEGMLHGHLNRLPGLAEVDRSLSLFADALTALESI